MRPMQLEPRPAREWVHCVHIGMRTQANLSAQPGQCSMLHSTTATPRCGCHTQHTTSLQLDTCHAASTHFTCITFMPAAVRSQSTMIAVHEAWMQLVVSKPKRGESVIAATV